MTYINNNNNNALFIQNLIRVFFSRGVIFIGNKSYALEPALHAANNEHVLFPLENSRSDPFVCGVDSERDCGEDGSCDRTLSMETFLRVSNVLPCSYRPVRSGKVPRVQSRGALPVRSVHRRVVS